MKNTDTQQEILLITNSKFTSFDWQNKLEEKNNLTRIEKLEEGCWNGLMNELLPELLVAHAGSSVNLWHIHTGKNFLDLEYGNTPEKIEKSSCINPHIFMEFQQLS